MATLLLSAVVALTLASPDVEVVERLWSGVHDSSEQIVVSTDKRISSWPEGAERRVRTIVEPVALTWLGSHVLYLEEFLHDEPDDLRRQILLQLETDPQSASVRAHLFTFATPGRWAHLNRRPELLSRLGRRDLVASSGCDLVLAREGDQFRGGTVGQQCRETAAKYVNYQLVIGQDLYWYRRRVFRHAAAARAKREDELVQEVVGFNWFELNEARLFTCRVAWSASGQHQDLRPLLRLDLHDEGGHARFATPDGRKLELTLHGQDWPYSAERDALLLLISEQGRDADQYVPFASAWAPVDTERIAVELEWLQVRCATLVPESDELMSGRVNAAPGAIVNAAPGGREHRYPSTTPG